LRLPEFDRGSAGHADDQINFRALLNLSAGVDPVNLPKLRGSGNKITILQNHRNPDWEPSGELRAK